MGAPTHSLGRGWSSIQLFPVLRAPPAIEELAGYVSSVRGSARMASRALGRPLGHHSVSDRQ